MSSLHLSVDGVTCGYGPQPVLRQFSLSVERGAFLAVVGPNGSGKSTLVKAISGGLRPTEGRICLNGREIGRLKHKELAREIAVVAQEERVEFDFTVREVVLMGRLPYLPPLRSEGARDLGLAERAMRITDTLRLQDRSITALSGGERQRVFIARALAQEPSLLILDEPTAHLDIAHQVELLDLVRRLNRAEGLTIVAVLHDLNLAAQYAHRMLLLKDGARFAEGRPDEVVTEEIVGRAYGNRVRVMPHPEEQSPHVILLSGGTAWE